MDISRLYGSNLPVSSGKTPAARSDSDGFKIYSRWEEMISSYTSAYTGSLFGGQASAASYGQSNSVPDSVRNLFRGRNNGYAMSSRPKLTDSEIREFARKYDFWHMTQETYDAFLDDLVEAGLLTRAETGYFGYGGEIRLDPADSRVGIMRVAGLNEIYGQHTPFLEDDMDGSGDMVAWLREIVRGLDFAWRDDPEASERADQRHEMYGALVDVVSRATGTPIEPDWSDYAVVSDEGDIIGQILNPNSSFYQDMYNRMRIQMEQSEEEKKKQAIIDALDSILETLSAKKNEWWKKPDAVSSMTGLAQTIDSLDKDDPRKEELNLLRERLQSLGIYIDLDIGVKGKNQSTWGTTLTQQLIREEAKDTYPSIFDII